MKPRSDPGNVVATRLFDRADGKVELSIHQPSPDLELAIGSADPDDPPWRCWYSIRFPDGEIKQRSAVGIDAIQALLLAFAVARVDMQYVGDGTPTRRPEILWHGETNLGLTINHIE
jgi:hypothetical protein